LAILTVPRPDEIEAFVGRFDLGELRAARGIEAGTVNTSYALEIAHDRYFLRIYEEQGRDGALREAALLTHLAAQGIPTPCPVPARDGSRIGALAGKPAALFPWVDGEILCQKRVTEAHGRDVGAALARVHGAGPPPGSTPDEGRFTPSFLVTRCDRVAASTDAAAARQAAPLRDAVLAVAERRARRPGLPSGLVHGDLFRDNVLWDARKIVALLDFESAHHGPFAYDLAVTILSWSYGDELSFPIARAIVAGYRSVRELAHDERDALYDETILASLRFTITRITDDAIRVGKRWQRFVARREAVESVGRDRWKEELGL
jgi:homoserine kinase type II